MQWGYADAWLFEWPLRVSVPLRPHGVPQLACVSNFLKRAAQSHIAIRALTPLHATLLHTADGSFRTLSDKDFQGRYTVLFWCELTRTPLPHLKPIARPKSALKQTNIRTQNAADPLDFTFVCPTEITNFSDANEQFKAINCDVVGVSIDSVFSHLAWVNTSRNKGGLGKMNIPLVGDISKEMTKAFGMLVEDPADDMVGASLRGTVIIDGAGKVRHISNTDAPVGRSVDEVLRLVQAFQFVEKHGEVCPAGWKPGKATMKADPKGSQVRLTAGPSNQARKRAKAPLPNKTRAPPKHYRAGVFR